MFLRACLLLLACSCTVKPLAENKVDIDFVGISVFPLHLDDETRSTITLGETIDFLWEETDTVGIFPNVGSQVYFDMYTSAGSNYAKFEGGGWALKGSGEYRYAAYYPYLFDTHDPSKIYCSFSGQVQHGNNDYTHLTQYQYLASGSVVPSDGALDFSLKRVETVLMFILTMPSAKEYERMRIALKSGDPIAIDEKVNIGGEEPVVTPTRTVPYVDLLLSDVHTEDNNLTLVLYMMLPPQDLTGQELLISVDTVDGDTCWGIVAGKNMKMNNGCRYVATLNSDLGSLMEKFEGVEGHWN